MVVQVFGLYCDPIRVNKFVINRQWMSLVITLDGCSGRTQWSSSLDWTPTYTTFYSGCTISPQSHVLLECSVITWPCYMTLVPTLFISQPHCMFWGSRSSVQMLGKIFPFWGSHNKIRSLGVKIIKKNEKKMNKIIINTKFPVYDISKARMKI